MDRTDQERRINRKTLPTLFMTSLAIQPPGILTGLLLIEICKSYSITLGVAGQIRTLSPIVASVTGLLMAILSVKYNQKTLLLIGLSSICISSIGCVIAPDFISMLIIYSLSGLGGAMIIPMGQSIIGDIFPSGERAEAIAWVTSAGSFAYVVGAPLTGFFAGLGGWQLAFLAFPFVVAFISLLLAIKFLPSVKIEHKTDGSWGKYFEGITMVLSNRSALSCLIGNTLAVSAWTVILVYTTSYVRQVFQVSTGYASIYLLICGVFFTGATIYSGKLVRRIGSKRIILLSLLAGGVLIILHFNLNDFWLSVVSGFACCLFFGARIGAATNLSLEQVPAFRGSMMSLNSMVGSIGLAIGSGVGGYVLDRYNFGMLGIFFSAFSFLAAIAYQLLTTEP